MRILAYELSLSLRRLSRRPSQSLLMLMTLSVSLALSLLGWSLFHTMFLRQPAFDPSGSLFRIGVTGELINGRIIQVTREDFNAWKAEQTVFSEFAPAMLYQSTFLTTDSGIERFLGANISSDLLRMVGAAPMLGRLFTPEEDNIGCAPVILISEELWRTRFNADAGIIGKSVVVDGTSATVVGVMPKSFRFPNAQDLWQPLGFSPHERTPTVPVMDIVVRLKPGITLQRALDDMIILAERRTHGPIAQFKFKPVITPFREYYLHADMSRSAAVLFALSLVFVLVSCANAANLVMVDFFGRTTEVAASLALGVPRSAAMRGLAIQLFVTAIVAALIGFLVLLAAGPSVHSAMARVTTPYWLLFSLQWHHVGMALVLALGAAALAMVVPLAYMAFLDFEQFIRKESGATRVSGRGVWRRGLMIGQIALLTILSIAAGLLLRSTRHARTELWGFDGRSIFATKTSTPESSFPTPEIRFTTHLRLLDELEATPSIAAAGLMSNPIGFSRPPRVKYARTVDDLAEGSSPDAAVWSAVTPHLFSALDVPFIEGETFQSMTPRVSAQPANALPVVITASVAQKLWPGESALGRGFYARFPVDVKEPPTRLVVQGVLRQFQASGPKADVNDGIFSNFDNRMGMPPASFLYVRGKHGLPPFEDLRTAATRADPRMAIYFQKSLQDTIDIELSSVHLTTRLTFAYAFAAVLLCIVGIYSITIAQVQQRNRELGIRMALGIEAKRLWFYLMRSHVLTASIGLAVGLASAAALAHVLAALLFGVKAHDVATFVSVGFLIVAVSGLACIPSLFRLSRLNPAECLRSI